MTTEPMSRNERLNVVLQLITEAGEMSVETAAAQLGVSVATTRRDFDHLASRQLVTRTHGGAVAIGAGNELPLAYKVAKQDDAKQMIGRACASLVQPDMVIGINGGTTSTEAGRAIASSAHLKPSSDGPTVTIVTNALSVATELVLRPHMRVVVTGGVARPQSYELYGPLANPVLEQVVIDIAFIGVNGVDPFNGAMANHEGEAAVSRLFAERARKVVVIADSTKIGKTSFARILPVEQIDAIITDAMPKEYESAFRDRGVEIIIAQ